MKWRKTRDSKGDVYVPTPATPTMLDRLKELRCEKEIDYVALEQQLTDLDVQISWLRRHPEAEKILAALQKRIQS